MYFCCFFYFTKVKADATKTVVITFKETPTTVNVSKAPLKYNKDFVFSMNADDGIKDSYNIFYKTFNGGRIANSSIFSKGAYFTDGTGNKIPFRGNFQLTTMNTNVADSFVTIRNIGNISYVDWAEATEVSNKGWDITNHGWSHNGFPVPVDRIFPYPAPHNPSTIDYDYEIEQNQISIENNVGQRPTIMGQPDADPGYDPYIFNNHGIFAKIKKFSSLNRYIIPGVDVSQTLNLNQYNIMGYVYISSQDTITDLINFIDHIKNSSINGAHYWNRLTMHRFYEAEGQAGIGYQSFKQLVDHIENNYGYKGADNAWVASSQEVYEYLYAKQNLNIVQNLSGKTLTLSLDFGNYPDSFKRQSISLLVDSEAEILNVTSPDSSSNLSFNPTSGLINTDFRFFNNNAFESDCIAEVERVETSRTQTDYNKANDYVNAMDASLLKDNLRTRLNNVEIFAREWYISFGTSTILSRGLIWNGVNALNTQDKTLNEATGMVSSLKYNTINTFGGTGSTGMTPSPADSGIYADNITKSYVYPVSSPATPILFKISNLDPNKVYDVELFSSKTSSGSSTYYIIGRTNSETKTLDMYGNEGGNISRTVIFPKIVPSATNDIQVNLAVGGRLAVLHLTERPKIEIPVASYPSGTYNTTQNISLSSMESDYIKYSTIAIPTTCAEGTLYSSPINISSSQTIYAKACDNQDNFAVATYEYVIDSIPPSTPVASPVSGTYNTDQSVTLSSEGSDYIKYSWNEIPTTCSYGTLYSSPINISSSQIIYVRACDNAENSSTESFSYIITQASPLSFSYTSPNTFTINSAITSLSPTVTGTGITYSISPSLPTGLSFDTSTGTISGTPTTNTSINTYTVTATNSGGSTTFGIVITVNESSPTTLSYTTPNVFTRGTIITPLTSTVTGLGITYSVTPALPTGLSFDTSTGTISGTPTTNTSINTYTVTATNSGGSTTFGIVITVNDIPGAPVISSISNTPNNSGVNISWITNKNSSSKLNYGLTNTYTTSTPETDTTPRVTTHTVTISNLAICTTYHYQVRSKDAANNEGVSTDNTFTTLGCIGGSTVLKQSSGASTAIGGGTINLNTADESNVSIVVPPGATTSSIIIQSKELPSSFVFAVTNTPSNVDSVGTSVYNFTALSNLNTLVTTFNQPISITLPYNPSELGSIDESSLKIYSWNGTTWSELTSCIVNTTLHTVTCSTTHFSIFGLFGTKIPTAIITTTNHTSSGSTILSRYNNLLAMGNTQAASQLKAEFPNQFPTTVAKDTVSKLTFTKILKLNMVNNEVKELQKYLNTHGYIVSNSGAGSLGKETTKFGPATKKAVIKFQIANKLKGDGIVGVMTREKMK